MKKNILFIVLAAGIVSLGFTTKTGDNETITPAVPSFDAVEINAPVDAVVTVKGGVTPGIKLTGNSEAIERIKTTVSGNTLVITTKPHGDWHSGENWHVNAEITLPVFTALTIGGASGVAVHGDVSGNKFDLDIAGSGSVDMDDLSVAGFTSVISGSGSVKISGGAVSKAKYKITGSGKIKAFDLHAKEVFADITGSGKCEVNAGERLDADISGSGSVVYKGHPAIVHKDITGSGSVKNGE